MPVADDIVAHIAANVRRLRLRAFLTQETLAEKAGVDLSYLQRVEWARMNLTVRKLALIAKALQVSPSRLLRPARFSRPPKGRPRA